MVTRDQELLTRTLGPQKELQTCRIVGRDQTLRQQLGQMKFRAPTQECCQGHNWLEPEDALHYHHSTGCLTGLLECYICKDTDLFVT